MKLDLYRVVELFRKSFSISLSDREKEELDDVLQDDYLKEAYDQLLCWINFENLISMNIGRLLIS